MAILDNTDFQKIKKIIKSDPAASGVFKTWGLSKAELKSAFQAAEDWFVTGFTVTPTTSFKASLEASDAGSMTDAQAKQVGFIWMAWRFKVNP